MDQQQKSQGKRNNKKQKNTNAVSESKNNNLISTNKPQDSLRNDPEPQPQRANRRNRTEPVERVLPVETPASHLPDKKSEPEVKVDHSHLKRETEEISKLTKKFSRREITSNWHKYEAPEIPKYDQEDGGDGPADFSDLIQISASRGAHLQLKEEQSWSSVSGEELGGYFALDLKLLESGLACIPEYERLRLPRHILMDEDFKQFDDVANEAKKKYAHLTNCEETVALEPRTDLEVKHTSCDSDTITNLSHSSVTSNLDINISDPTEESNCGKTYEIDMQSSLNEKCLRLSPSESQQDSKKTNNLLENLTPDTVLHDKEPAATSKIAILPNEVLEIKEMNSLPTKPTLSLQTKSEEKMVIKQKVANLIIDQRDKKNNILEEDDELDYLLSLKNPVNITTNIQIQTTPVKETSILPSGSKVVQTSSEIPSSELDDWLDSVLDN